MNAKIHYRTVWLSDIHLGYKDCKAEYLLNFLENTRIDTLYLVGDIVDMWALSKQFRWPASHNRLFHKLLSLSGGDTNVIYLPGNHDEPVQKYDGMAFGDVAIHREFIHETASGQKLLLLHGDQFDQEVCFGRLHAWVGDKAYDFLLFANRWYNYFRNKLGYPYWSLAGHVKSKIRGANEAIERYRHAAACYASKLDVDGVVCGHIHHPEVVNVKGCTYMNTGDWIENCSALTESHTGDIELIYWTEIRSNIRAFDANTKRSKKAA